MPIKKVIMNAFTVIYKYGVHLIIVWIGCTLKASNKKSEFYTCKGKVPPNALTSENTFVKEFEYRASETKRKFFPPKKRILTGFSLLNKNVNFVL